MKEKKQVKSKVKKKRISPKRKLEMECFSLWSDCIIARDKTCRYTNSDERLSGHHIRSRTHHATRFNLENGICLSWKVHFLQKANPERFQDMVIEIIGDEKYQALKRMSQVVVDQTVADLQEIKEHLQEQLRKFKTGVDFENLPF